MSNFGDSPSKDPPSDAPTPLSVEINAAIKYLLRVATQPVRPR